MRWLWQSAEFVPAIYSKDFEYVQVPRENAFKKIVQYVGVSRLDKPGIIQISYTPTRLIAAEKVADFSYIADNFRIGQGGRLRIKKLEDVKDLPLDKFNELGEYYYSDNENLYLAKRVEDVVLIGNLPNKEMYISRDDVVASTTIAYLILFFIIFLLISNLLQTVVIDGIYSVNDSLTKIKDGNLDEKVEVHTAIEFDDLSLGINTTVDSLKELKEKEANKYAGIPQEVVSMVEARVEAKKAKDFKKADELRDQVKAMGYTIKDTPNGAEIIKD